MAVQHFGRDRCGTPDTSMINALCYWYPVQGSAYYWVDIYLLYVFTIHVVHCLNAKSAPALNPDFVSDIFQIPAFLFNKQIPDRFISSQIVVILEPLD